MTLFTFIFNVLTISGFEKSTLISLYLGAFKLVLKVKSVPSFVMYWREDTQCVLHTCIVLKKIEITKRPKFRTKSKLLAKQNLRPWQTRTHCCRHIVADTNVSPFARARNICCRHKFCVRDTKMFLILFRNILCPQQMFPSLRSSRNIMDNNVSATICPRLPGPLQPVVHVKNVCSRYLFVFYNSLVRYFWVSLWYTNVVTETISKKTEFASSDTSFHFHQCIYKA